jgi:phenylpropionate dioxygenase-like ring-hydroxylating dioxygenase large terminal subunit
MATKEMSRLATYQQLVRQDCSDFRVHSRLYTDPQIFEDEMTFIFERTWVYVGHESEIAHPGDYKTSYIGRQPVIITRGKDNEIYVLLNACRHRANALCREERGNSFNFRCPYHAWTYTNTGSLIGVSDRPRYPEAFDATDLNLLHAARVGSHRGLIFASLSADVPSLEEHLGEAKRFVDLWADRSLVGDPQLLLPHRYAYEGNWKFQVENSQDGYHAGITHESAFATYAHFGIGKYTNRRPIESGGITRDIPGGHSSLEYGFEGGRGNARSLPALSEQYLANLAKRHGEEQAREIMSSHHVLIFPNLMLFDDLVRVVQPVSLEYTEVYSHPFALGGVPDEFNARRLYEVTRQLSTTGVVNAADLEMFAANQTGVHVRDMEWLVLCRGMDQETVLPTGERVGERADEAPQRAFYRQWLQLMARASEWA